MPTPKSTSCRCATALVRHRVPAVLAVAVCIGPIPAQAQTVMPDPSVRIGLWGTPVTSQAPSAGRRAAPLDDDAGGRAAKPVVQHGVTFEQSRWAGSSLQGRPLDRPSPGADAVGSGRSGVEVTDLSYRWGLADGRNAMDIGLGAGVYRVRPDSAGGGVPFSPAAGAGYGTDGRRDAIVPTFSVGMRHSLSDDRRVNFYASGSASLASAAVGEFYTARVKVEWLPTKNSGIGFEQAAVNMKFGANSNFALRVRGRGPVIYYRSKF